MPINARDLTEQMMSGPQRSYSEQQVLGYAGDHVIYRVLVDAPSGRRLLAGKTVGVDIIFSCRGGHFVSCGYFVAVHHSATQR